MRCMFTMRDIDRMCRETGVSREEAVLRLKRADGDYKKAMRSYVSERSVCVEPVSVEDNKSAGAVLLERMKNVLRFVSARRRALWAVSLVVIMLALVLMPQTISCALLLSLFLGWSVDRMINRAGQTA